VLTPQPKDKLLSPYIQREGEREREREETKIGAKAQPKEKQNKV